MNEYSGRVMIPATQGGSQVTDLLKSGPVKTSSIAPNSDTFNYRPARSGGLYD